MTKTSSDYLELIRHLVGLIHGRRIYPSRHPVLTRSLARLDQVLETLMEGREEVVLGVLGSRLLADGLAWEDRANSNSALAQELKSRRVEKLIFRKGVTVTDLEALLDALCPRAGSGPSTGLGGIAIIEALEQRGVTHIRVAQLELEADSQSSMVPEIVSDQGTYQEAVDGLADTMQNAKNGRAIRLEQVQNLVGLLIEHITRDPGPLLMLTALKNHSDYTFVHIVNVTILTLTQIQSITDDRDTVREYGIAAMMHDMGKMQIPQEILSKREPLTEEEFTIIRRHPIDTYRILRETPGMTDLPLIVGFEHHRRYDLTGYPEVSHRRPQHFASRMCALADAYDAMRSNRCYQREMSPEKVMTVVQEQSGKMFDPVLVHLFSRMIGSFPPGTRVRLSSGEEAMVLRINPADPIRPYVRILRDDMTERDFLQTVDLTLRHPKTGAYLRSIETSLADQPRAA